jgi:hypothetical protein
MKKLYILALSTFTFSSVNAQYLAKNFEDLDLNSGGWNMQMTTGTTDWYASNQGSDNFAKISNYDFQSSSNLAAESWLISPSFDLSTSTAPELTFETVMKFAGAPVALKISNDYDGTSNPNSQGTWVDLTSLATWDVDDSDWGPWTPSGVVDLTTYINATTYIAFVYTGSNSDGSTWEVDNIAVNENGYVGPNVSIYDIQYSTNGSSLYSGSTVITKGVVVAESSGTFNDNDRGYWLQDGAGGWNGIFVHDIVNTVTIGDSVELAGSVIENFNHTIIDDVSNFSILNSGNTPAAPSIITVAEANSEQYEGVLVTVETVNCTNPAVGFGVWELATATDTILVDDVIYEYITPVINGVYSVTGPLYYAYNEFKILPRYLADIVNSTGINETTTLITSVYPNPVNEFVNIEAPANSTLTILSIEGKVVINTVTNNAVEMIDVSSLESGSYIVSISNNNAFSTQILIKK